VACASCAPGVGLDCERWVSLASAADQLPIRLCGPLAHGARNCCGVFTGLRGRCDHVLRGPPRRTAGLGGRLLGIAGPGGLADQPRHQHPGRAVRGLVAPDLYCQHFDPGHLLVQELHQPLQAGRNLIGDERRAGPSPPAG
jgi:hypothetical protein